MTGRIEAMTFAEYRAAKGVNLSRLKHMEVSPRKYAVNPGKDSKPLALGRGIHSAVLEPDKFAEEYVVWGTRRAGKKWEEFVALNPGKEIINRTEFETIARCAESVRRHPVAGAYLNEGVAEQAVFWTHEPTGLECKSLIDWNRDGLLLDLKSARDVSKRGFGNSASSYDYFAQLSFYAQALKSVDGRDRKVAIVAVETSSPFDVVAYTIADEWLELGRRRYESWLEKLAECIESDCWPGVSDSEVPLAPADWYVNQFDEGEVVMPGGEVVAV